MSLLERVYERSPVLVQNVMATAYGVRQRLLRHRGEYSEFVKRLDEQQWLPPERLQELQDALVRRTVKYAAQEIPYYRELFREQRLDARDIRSAADLGMLPFTDKSIVQKHGSRMRPDRLAVKALRQTTGGTTGRPVPYWVTPTAVQFNYATYEARFRAWAGVNFGDRMVSINGKPIVPMTQQGPPYWRHNIAFNQLYVSAYHLGDDTLGPIVQRMARFAPRVIVAYVSAVHRIARYMLEHSLEGIVRPHAILVSSETLSDAQRDDIERAFTSRVFNGYSLGEPVCFVSECSHGSMHISPEYGVIELVEQDGKYEVVATGLVNDAMPLLRYRTGDEATPSTIACSCGRGLPTIGPILGRVDEFVITPEGSAVGPASLSLAFQSIANLRESQIHQMSSDRIRLLLNVTSQYGAADEACLIAELRKRLGLRLRIDVEYVTAIPKTVSGKQRLVVSGLRGSR
jgi:phenylacetate-CoA ligase